MTIYSFDLNFNGRALLLRLRERDDVEWQHAAPRRIGTGMAG